MTSMPRMLLPNVLLPGVLLAACVCVPLSGAWAQGASDADSRVKFQSGLLQKKPKPGLPDVKPQPQAWPRLDPGAVLCKTEDDLDRLTARRNGEAVDGTVDCQIIREPTAIAIVDRNGLARTHVKVSNPHVDEDGWTDAWLPNKAPSAGTRSASR